MTDTDPQHPDATHPGPEATAAEWLSALGEVTRAELGALLGRDPGPDVAAGDLREEGGLLRPAPGAPDPLEGAPLRRAALLLRAAELDRPGAGGEESERRFVARTAAACELLLRADPAGLAPALAGAPIGALRGEAGRHLLRYYAALGEGLADRLGEARAAFAELLAEPGLERAVRGRALNSGALFAQMQGDHQAALDAYAESRAIWAELGDRVREANVLHNQGILRYELRELAAAAEHFGAAAAIYAAAGDDHRLAMSSNELGLVLRDEGRWAEASAALERAAAIFAAEGARNALGIVSGNLGEVELARGRYDEAEARLRQALDLMTSQVYAVDYQINLGLIAQARGDDAAALGRYAEAADLAERLGRREIRALAQHRMGHALARLGRAAEAEARYDAAVEAVEAVRAPLRDEGLLVSLMGRWQLVYESALLSRLARGDSAGALVVAERARARAFADQLARHAADAPQGATATAEEVCAGLPEGALLLAYFAAGLRGPESALLDAMPPEAAGLRACLTPEPRLALLAATREGVRALACPIDPNALAGASGAERFLHPAVLRRAYDALVAPAEGLIRAAGRLVVVPHGPLHQLPFAALAGPDGRALLDWAPPTELAPSATVYLRGLAGAGRPRGQGLLAVGHDGGRGLRHTEAEAAAVARLAGGEAMLGRAGARRALLEGAGGYRLVHLACHGEFDMADPLGSWLEPGPGERLTAAEVLAGARLSADLVVLSACRSGAALVLRGDEPMGLTRAFLGAGARAVAVTLWQVEDSSARLLMERFYRELFGGPDPDTADPAAALRRAQLALRGLARGEARALLGAEPPPGERPYADPRHWAAFVLIRG